MKYRGFDLQFYIILSVDANLDSYGGPEMASLPISLRGVLDLTEDDSDDEYGLFENARHRKWAGVIDAEQLDRIVCKFNLFAQSIETMGSLTEFGLIPAISFSAPVYNNFTPQVADNEYLADAYVTPFIDTVTLNEYNWAEIKELIMEVYG